MFEQMTEKQAREQILEMTKEYCEKTYGYSSQGGSKRTLPCNGRPAQLYYY